MKIHDGERVLKTYCRGCMCHDVAMQFGELMDGCCRECGCPKTRAAYDRMYQEQQERRGLTGETP